MRPLSEQEVRQIADDAAKTAVERETSIAFERMDLLKDGKPDWKSLAAPAKGWQRRAARKEKFVQTIFPFLVLAGTGWVLGNLERVLSMLSSAVSFLRGGPQ